MKFIIYIFTLIMGFCIYKIVNKYERSNRSKNHWRMLIYWGTVIFISIIFNVLLYVNNPSNYSLNFYLNKENVQLIFFLVLSFALVHIISPSGFSGKAISKAKVRFSHKNNSTTETPLKHDDTMMEEATHSINLSSKDITKENVPKVSIDPKNNFTQEKDFELFLNTLCWLAFSFVVLLQLLIFIVGLLQYKHVPMVSSESFINSFPIIINKLNDIASLLMLSTLPICIRQIFFYLSKLRNGEYDPVSTNSNSVKEENTKYLIVQNRLSEINKKL